METSILLKASKWPLLADVCMQGGVHAKGLCSASHMVALTRLVFSLAFVEPARISSTTASIAQATRRILNAVDMATGANSSVRMEDSVTPSNPK